MNSIANVLDVLRFWILSAVLLFVLGRAITSEIVISFSDIINTEMRVFGRGPASGFPQEPGENLVP